MNESVHYSCSKYYDHVLNVTVRSFSAREVISGDYYIPSSVLRKIIDDVARAATESDTLDALDAVLKNTMHYETYITKGTN